MTDHPTDQPDRATDSSGPMAWIKRTWDEPTGVGKAKLVAIVVLVLVFFALFARDDVRDPPAKADSAQVETTPNPPPETRPTDDGRSASNPSVAPPDERQVTLPAPPDEQAASSPGAPSVDSAGQSATGGDANDAPAEPLAQADVPSSRFLLTEPMLSGNATQALVTTGSEPTPKAEHRANPSIAVAPQPPSTVAATDPEDVARVQAELAAAKAENDRLQQLLADRQVQVEQLKQDLAQAQEQAADSSLEDQLKAQVDSLQEQLNDLLDTLKNQIDKYGRDDRKPAAT